MSERPDKSQLVRVLRAAADKIERNLPLSTTDISSLHRVSIDADKFTVEGMLKSDNVMARAAFDRLSDTEKTAFMRGGGILVDVPAKVTT
jgi:hypothetical protein